MRGVVGRVTAQHSTRACTGCRGLGQPPQEGRGRGRPADLRVQPACACGSLGEAWEASKRIPHPSQPRARCTASRLTWTRAACAGHQKAGPVPFPWPGPPADGQRFVGLRHLRARWGCCLCIGMGGRPSARPMVVSVCRQSTIHGIGWDWVATRSIATRSICKSCSGLWVVGRGSRHQMGVQGFRGLHGGWCADGPTPHPQPLDQALLRAAQAQKGGLACCPPHPKPTAVRLPLTPPLPPHPPAAARVA